MVASSSFGLLPLNKQDREIRILVLYPSAKKEADIVCEVFKFNINKWVRNEVEQFPYLALSYVWGAREPAKTILLGGEEKEVTPILFEALRDIRDPSVPMLLWVDALCIDQGNTAEVNSQVTIMDTIYGGAGTVLAWVSGQENDIFLPETAMKVLIMLEWLVDNVEYRIGRPSAEQGRWHKWLELLASGYGPYAAIDNMFRTDYFSRVWTMQEVFLSCDVLICHGGYVVYFRTLLFKYAQDGRWSFPQPSEMSDDHADNLHVESFLASYYDSLCGKAPTVLEALLLAQDRKATVKHDSVYGILGLLKRTESDTETISSWRAPDYNRTYFSICFDIFRDIVNGTGELDVLSACELRRHYGQEPAQLTSDGKAWPSWLPDWSIGPLHPGHARSILATADPTNTSVIYAASQDTRLRFSLRTADDDEDILQLTGVVVDVVQTAFDQEWFGIYVEDWIGATIPKNKKPLPDQLRKRYVSDQQMESALLHLLSFGHIGIEKALAQRKEDHTDPDGTGVNTALSSEKNEDISRDDVRKMAVNTRICPPYPSRMFLTKEHYIGRGPTRILCDGKIVIFMGAKVPFVIRPVPGRQPYFTLVGECYIHEIMQGQAITPTSFDNAEEFELI